MSFVHGKDTFVSLDGDDLSAYTNQVEFEQEAEAHDTTTFGNTSKTYQGGLKDGTVSLEGIYDNTSGTGPAAVIRPLLGSSVTLVYRPEGTGSGKPSHSATVVVTTYAESAPVADMVTWSAELQLSDDITSTTQ